MIKNMRDIVCIIFMFGLLILGNRYISCAEKEALNRRYMKIDNEMVLDTWHKRLFYIDEDRGKLVWTNYRYEDPDSMYHDENYVKYD